MFQYEYLFFNHYAHFSIHYFRHRQIIAIEKHINPHSRVFVSSMKKKKYHTLKHFIPIKMFNCVRIKTRNASAAMAHYYEMFVS